MNDPPRGPKARDACQEKKILTISARSAVKLSNRESRSERRWRHLDVGSLDAQSKLAISWYVGGRDSGAAMIFMDDLAKRLANRVQ